MEAIRPHGLSSRTVIHFPSYDQNSGGKRLKSKQNNGAAPMILVQIALCLILASRLTSVQSCGSGKIVFGSTATAASGIKRVSLLWQRLMPRSVVITGQPGIGVFLSSVTSCALSNNPSCEKVKHFGSLTPSVVVSANRSHFFGMKMATVFLFVRDGVFQRNDESVSACEFARFVWAFVDTDERSTGVLGRLGGFH